MTGRQGLEIRLSIGPCRLLAVHADLGKHAGLFGRFVACRTAHTVGIPKLVRTTFERCLVVVELDVAGNPQTLLGVRIPGCLGPQRPGLRVRFQCEGLAIEERHGSGTGHAEASIRRVAMRQAELTTTDTAIADAGARTLQACHRVDAVDLATTIDCQQQPVGRGSIPGLKVLLLVMIQRHEVESAVLRILVLLQEARIDDPKVIQRFGQVLDLDPGIPNPKVGAEGKAAAMEQVDLELSGQYVVRSVCLRGRLDARETAHGPPVPKPGLPNVTGRTDLRDIGERTRRFAAGRARRSVAR